MPSMCFGASATDYTGTFLSRAGVARMRQTWLSSPLPIRGGYPKSNSELLFFSLCVALRSHVRPLTHAHPLITHYTPHHTTPHLHLHLHRCTKGYPI